MLSVEEAIDIALKKTRQASGLPLAIVGGPPPFGLDSLATVTFLVELEDLLEINIPDTIVLSSRSLEDFRGHIEGLI